MKHVKEFEEFFDDGQEILVFIPSDIIIPFVDQLLEGIWMDSAVEKRMKVRVEKHNDGLKHVHVSKPQHTSNKSKQVAWNEDGTIHDKKSFNHKFDGIERAKNAARTALGISSDILLLEYSDIERYKLIMKYSLSEDLIIFIATRGTASQILLD